MTNTEMYTVRFSAVRVERCPLAVDRPIRDVVAELVKQYGLPETDEQGRAIAYSLYTHPNARLSGEQTLAQVGVGSEAVLYLADRQQPWWEASSDAPPPEPAPLPPPPKRPWQLGEVGQALPFIGGGVVVVAALVVTLAAVFIAPAWRPTSENGSEPSVPLSSATLVAEPMDGLMTSGTVIQPSVTLAPAATLVPTPTLAPTDTPTPETAVVTVSGIQESYRSINPSYFFRGRTSFGAYLFADAELQTKVPATNGDVVVSNGDQVAILQDAGTVYQIRVISNKLDPDDPKVIGAIGYLVKWLVDNQNVPPTPTPSPRPTAQSVRLRVSKLNSNDSPNCFSMQISGINTAGWTMRVDGMELVGRFDGGGNARICGLNSYQEVTYTIYDNTGRSVPGGQGIPVRGSDIMVGVWK